MIERLARLGYASKGVVYGVIGLLALGSIFGRGRVANHEGAFSAIGRQPFGTFILYLIAVGLLGYATWRVVESVGNPEGHTGPARVVLFIRGVFHGFIAFEVFRFAAGQGGGGGGAQHWTARLMEKPFGGTLVSLAGIAIGLYGIGQLVAAAMAKLDKRLRLGQIEPDRRRWIVRLGRIGLAARGIVFAIVGWFLIRAGMRHDPSQARDIGGALRELAGGPTGTPLLAIISVGLLAYGLYELTKSRYKRI